MKKYMKKRKELKDIYKEEMKKYKKPMKQKVAIDEIARIKAKAKRKAPLKYGRTTKQKITSAATSTRKAGSRVKKRTKKLAKAYKKSPIRKAGLNWAKDVLKGFD